MKKSSNLNLLLTLLTALALVSCVSKKPVLENSMTLYSPELLRLKAGTKVQTLDGVYTSQVDETWHSHARYLDRVREALRP